VGSLGAATNASSSVDWTSRFGSVGQELHSSCLAVQAFASAFSLQVKVVEVRVFTLARR